MVSQKGQEEDIRANFWLISVTALCLISKFEIHPGFPISIFSLAADLPAEDIRAMEVIISGALDFKYGNPTSLAFLR